ncbi:MAG: lipopolysaccharide biosynthesis protein [Planctomycetota bacterium]
MRRFLQAGAVHREAFAAMAVRGVGIGLTFLSTTTLARIMGPDAYGAYSAALASATLLAALAPLGTDRILIRTLSGSDDDPDCGQQVAVVHAATGAVAAVIVIGAVLASLVAAWFAARVDAASTALRAAILFIPLTLIYLRQWMAIPLIGTRRAVAMEQIVLPIATVSVVIAGLLVGIEFDATLMSISTAVLLSILWVASTQQTRMRQIYAAGIGQISAVNLSHVSACLSKGLPFVSVAIGSVLTQSCIPVVIAFTAGFSSAAFFAIAVPYASVAAIPLGMFALSMFRTCALHYERGEWVEANHSVRSAATITFLMSIFISGGVWLAAPWITWVLGQNYEPVQRILPALLLATIVDSLTGPTIPVMQTMLLERLHARVMMLFVPIQFAIIAVMTSALDVEGAALGYLMTRCLWNAIVVIEIYRQRKLVMLPYIWVSQALTRIAAGRSSVTPPAESKVNQDESRLAA